MSTAIVGSVTGCSDNTSSTSGVRSVSGCNNFGGIDGSGEADGRGRGSVGLVVRDGDCEREGFGDAEGLMLGAKEDEGFSDPEGLGDDVGNIEGRSDGNKDADGRLEPGGPGVFVGCGVLDFGDLEPVCVGASVESDEEG